MDLVTIEQLRPGMVLATHATDRRGRLLIPAETQLSDRHVEALRHWGITHLHIEAGQLPTSVPAEMDAQTLSEITTATDDNFVNVDRGHPFIAALPECVVDRRATEWALTQSEP